VTEVYLPLYEAKMVNLFDHRFGTYEGATGSTIPGVTDAQHDDPSYEPLPRYWVSESAVATALGEAGARDWLLGWRDIARSTDRRTFVTAAIPPYAVGDTFLLATSGNDSSLPLTVGIAGSFAFDYTCRNKFSGTHLKFHVVKQLACPTPAQLDVPAGWRPSVSISSEIGDRVRELTFTSWRLSAFAQDMGDDGPPFRWLPARREQIRAELDAMVFHVYGLDRDEVDYVLDTFTVLRRYDERDHGEYRTKGLVLEFYDLLADAMMSGVPYATPIDPAPGFGPRHEESTRPGWMKEQA